MRIASDEEPTTKDVSVHRHFSGSSGSHEPFINPDLESATTFDLSPALMQDIGWVLQPQ